MRQLTRFYVSELILEHPSTKNLRCLLRILLPAVLHLNVTDLQFLSNILIIEVLLICSVH
jgi:hypothetical protein